MSLTSGMVYIYELPFSVRQEISSYLDDLNLWERLASLMQLKPQQKELIRRQQARNSPTNACLDIWGSIYNHTANELLILLNRMHLPKVMVILHEYVDVRHRRLITKVLREPNVNGTNAGVNNHDRNGDAVDNGNSSTDLSVSKVINNVKPITEVNYNDLTIGTNYWNENNVLGKGGFGKVYKGKWSKVNVAIKVMDFKQRNGESDAKVEKQQSLNELKHLMTRLHPNIVDLYGYCINGGKQCLVYQLMEGGSLDSRLQADAPLTWQQRYKICRDTAAGINFLHTSRDGKLIVHCDIKPGNVLLDEVLNAKLGDFGLAREIPQGKPYKVSKVYGTKFYLPKEYVHNKLLSETIDIFSFGIVLLETFTNKRINANPDLRIKMSNLLQNVNDVSSIQDLQKGLSEFLQNSNGVYGSCIKPPIPGSELNMFCYIIQLAIDCTKEKSVDRPPNMEMVIETLDKQNFQR